MIHLLVLGGGLVENHTRQISGSRGGECGGKSSEEKKNGNQEKEEGI